MKLKTFDKTITRTVGIGDCTVTINPKGTMFFSAATVTLLGLEPGSRLLLHQDQENRADWYMEKTTQKTGFEVRKYNTAGVTIVQSSALVREIQKSTGKSDKTTRFPVHEKPHIIGDRRLYLIVSKSNPILSL